MMRREGCVDEQSGPPIIPQRLEKADDRLVSRNRGVPGMFAEPAKDIVQERILEFLGNDVGRHSSPGHPGAEPFEVPVVKNREDALIRRCDLRAQAIQVFEFSIAPEIFRGQARRPKKIEDGPGEHLVAFAGDCLPLSGRECLAKGRFEIA